MSIFILILAPKWGKSAAEEAKGALGALMGLKLS